MLVLVGAVLGIQLANGGGDSPSSITELTTESLKMGFLSQNAQTSISTGGEAFQTLARKQ